MTALLPYFISGPPLFREAFNTSCDAINSLLLGNPYLEIMLPMVDVRDAASAHVVPLIDPFLLANNGRYLISTDSMWFSDIVDTINDARFELKIGKIKARKLSRIEIYLAAIITNKKLKEVLPFVKQELKIESSPDLIKALQRWDKLDPDQPVPITKSVVDMV
jgi:hypothetical protein